MYLLYKFNYNFRRRHNKCYACNICLDTFYTEEALKNHNITFHNQIGTYR